MEGYWAEQLGTYVWDSNPGYNAVWCSDNPRTGMKQSDETRGRISEANKGHIVSDETRQKISEAQKNISDETRRKLSVATTNMSDERRRKLSEAGKRAWASKRVIAFID